MKIEYPNIKIKTRKYHLLSEDEDMFYFIENPSLIKKDKLSSISYSYTISSLQEIYYREYVRKQCIKSCVEFIKHKLKHYNIWLLSSTNSWMKDSPRLQYFKLWKPFKQEYGNSLSLNEYQEEVVYGPEGVKAFGAARLKESELNIGIDILRSTNKGSSFIVLIPESYTIDIYEYINNGWGFYSIHNRNRFWCNIISCTCIHFGIFLRIFGEFDDPCVGVNAIMHKSIFEENFS